MYDYSKWLITFNRDYNNRLYFILLVEWVKRRWMEVWRRLNDKNRDFEEFLQQKTSTRASVNDVILVKIIKLSSMLKLIKFVFVVWLPIERVKRNLNESFTRAVFWARNWATKVRKSEKSRVLKAQSSALIFIKL